MSQLKVRLILHGHKHARHFSRITINAGEEDTGEDKEFEIAVVSTGTPTAGRDPGASGKLQFQFLRIDQNWRVEVTPYTAGEGTFQAKDPFFINNKDLQDKLLSYEQNRA